MYSPVVNKTSLSKDILIERTLPVPGQILIENNKEVAPYEHVGICTVSQKTLKLSEKFRPIGFKKDGQFYYYNSVLGKQFGTKITAPFNGNLTKTDAGTYEYHEEEKKYILLSGVWGEVSKISEKNSVLIKTNTIDVNLVVSTPTVFSGELVVFPNPTHLLEKFYLEGFGSDSADGKIIYVGNNISMSFLKDAVKYGIGAVIGGSADKEALNYALKSNISLGLFSGFGEIPTPDDVYTLLNSVASRYVFFQGERNILRIPMPKNDTVVSIKEPIKGPIAKVVNGARVLVLQKPYFGHTGVVDSLTESSIFVRFSREEKSVEVFSPNFFLLQD